MKKNNYTKSNAPLAQKKLEKKNQRLPAGHA
jgi:hypothetical protein